MPERNASVFERVDGGSGRRVRTAKEFGAVVNAAPAAAIEGHLRRGAFSRRFADVFGNRPLVAEVRNVERRHRLSRIAGVNEAVVRLVCERYCGVEGGAGHPPQ